jgi:hypothetical protein
MPFWNSPKKGKKWRRFQIEHLEDRYCPSVTVSAVPISAGHPMAGYDLEIVNTGGPATINILDLGNRSVSVSDGAGKMLGGAMNVRAIHYEGSSGDDTVSYTLAHTLTTSEVVYIDLGDGGNHAMLNFGGGVANANFSVCVVGGSGADYISTSLGAIINAHAFFSISGGAGNDRILFGAPVDIDARSTLNVLVNGGAGNDDLELAASGLIFGSLSVAAYGGDGSDTININVKVEEDSTGAVSAYAAGGAGADTITLAMNDYSGDDMQSTMRSVRAAIVDDVRTSMLTSTWNVKVTPTAPRYN